MVAVNSFYSKVFAFFKRDFGTNWFDWAWKQQKLEKLKINCGVSFERENLKKKIHLCKYNYTGFF